jgi:regulator of sigma E protease
MFEIFTHPVVVLLVMIGILVTIHELGHYLAAVMFDVRVEAFAVGFGPKLFGWRRGETEFKVCAIPLGGYVKMAGEMFGDGTNKGMENVDDPRSFLAKPRWQRLIIAFAGPLMNFILAFGLLVILYANRFPQVLSPTGIPTITAVLPQSPADKAGIQPQDKVVELNGVKNPRWEDFLKEAAISVNKPLRVAVERGGTTKELVVTPEPDPQSGLGDIGVEGAHEVEVGPFDAKQKQMPAAVAGIKTGDLILAVDGQPVNGRGALVRYVRAAQGRPVEIAVRRGGEMLKFNVQPIKDQDKTEKEPQWRVGIVPVPKMTYVALPLGEAVSEAFRSNVSSAGLIYRLLQGMLERRISGKSVDGPIGLAVAASEAAKRGLDQYIRMMAEVSLNLAVMNLLPIPILDGGAILMLLIEMVARRDLSLKLKENVLKLGLAFLLIVMVSVMYNDITKYIVR